MGKYMFEAHYTAEGAKGVAKEGGSARRAAVEKSIASVGGRLEAFYFAFGGSDAYVIADLPDNVSAAAMALAVDQSGMASTKTVVLLTTEEMDAAGKKRSRIAAGPLTGGAPARRRSLEQRQRRARERARCVREIDHYVEVVASGYQHRPAWPLRACCAATRPTGSASAGRTRTSRRRRRRARAGRSFAPREAPARVAPPRRRRASDRRRRARIAPSARDRAHPRAKCLRRSAARRNRGADQSVANSIAVRCPPAECPPTTTWSGCAPCAAPSRDDPAHRAPALVDDRRDRHVRTKVVVDHGDRQARRDERGRDEREVALVERAPVTAVQENERAARGDPPAGTGRASPSGRVRSGGPFAVRAPRAPRPRPRG